MGRKDGREASIGRGGGDKALWGSDLEGKRQVAVKLAYWISPQPKRANKPKAKCLVCISSNSWSLGGHDYYIHSFFFFDKIIFIACPQTNGILMWPPRISPLYYHLTYHNALPISVHHMFLLLCFFFPSQTQQLPYRFFHFYGFGFIILFFN